MAWTLLVLGCSWNPQLDEARRQAAECRLELETLRREQQAAPNAALIKAQRDRLEAQCEDLRNEVARLKAELRDKASAPTDSSASEQIERERRELQTALVAIRRSREEWEQSLADRQREIDILTNQVERLQQQLAEARRAGQAESRPSR